MKTPPGIVKIICTSRIEAILIPMGVIRLQLTICVYSCCWCWSWWSYIEFPVNEDLKKCLALRQRNCTARYRWSYNYSRRKNRRTWSLTKAVSCSWVIVIFLGTFPPDCASNTLRASNYGSTDTNGWHSTQKYEHSSKFFYIYRCSFSGYIRTYFGAFDKKINSKKIYANVPYYNVQMFHIIMYVIKWRRKTTVFQCTPTFVWSNFSELKHNNNKSTYLFNYIIL